MKSIRNIAFSALLAVGAFTTVTYTACSKDECKDVVCDNGGTCVSGSCNCPSYYSGTTCQTQIRTTYFNTYVGNGKNSNNGTYTDARMKFTTRGTDARYMYAEVTSRSGDQIFAGNVSLASNETFTIEQKTEDGDIITGTGTVSAAKASITIVFTASNNASDVLTITLSDMLKQ